MSFDRRLHLHCDERLASPSRGHPGFFAWSDHEFGPLDFIGAVARVRAVGMFTGCGRWRGGLRGKNRRALARDGRRRRREITFGADKKFVSEVRPRGFISNTLGQGVTGTIRGTWAIRGKMVTLNVSSAQDERLLNRETTGTIESFKANEIVVKSSVGETSTFRRLL
jgi:hypothetical protein